MSIIFHLHWLKTCSAISETCILSGILIEGATKHLLVMSAQTSQLHSSLLQRVCSYITGKHFFCISGRVILYCYIIRVIIYSANIIICLGRSSGIRSSGILCVRLVGSDECEIYTLYVPCCHEHLVYSLSIYSVFV